MIRSIHNNRRRYRRSAAPLRQLVTLLSTAMFLVFSFFPGYAADRAFDEYQVKAVFLYRLTLFVTWPDDASTNKNKPFIIGILGEDPFGEHIDHVVENEKSNGRPIHVRRYRSIEEVSATPSQVLFINPALRQRWPQLKQIIDPLATLTVSDMDQFCQLGGMINIRTQVNKIKIEINPDETRKSGLKISSKLRNVSRNVETSSKGDSR